MKQTNNKNQQNKTKYFRLDLLIEVKQYKRSEQTIDRIMSNTLEINLSVRAIKVALHLQSDNIEFFVDRQIQNF